MQGNLHCFRICAGVLSIFFLFAGCEKKAPVSTVTAYIITSQSHVPSLPGDSAWARPGDFVLENENLIAVIRQPGRTPGYFLYGGNLIDLALKLPDGSLAPDVLQQMSLLFNAGYTPDNSRVYIITRNGLPVVRAEGTLALYETLDFKAIFGIDLNTLWFIPDAILPKIHVITEYSLRETEPVVEVSVTVINRSRARVRLLPGAIVNAGDGEIFFANSPQGFGEQTFREIDFASWLQGRFGFSYIAPSGAVGFSQSKGVVLMHNPFSGKFEPLVLKPGEITTYTFYIIADEQPVAAARQFYARLKSERTVSINGRVAEEHTGRPVENARVAVLGPLPEENAYSIFVTGSDGRFSGRLPPGKYIFVAERDGLATSLTDVVTLSPESGSYPISLTVPRFFTVKFSVVNEKKRLIPAKISVIGLKNTFRPTVFRDVTWDFIPEGLATVVHACTGEGEVKLPPGRYEFVASRGVEYSISEKELEIVDTDVEISFKLYHVVNVPGFISGDFHVHAASFDAPLSNRERVITFATEGVEILGITDHDAVVDFSGYVKELELQDYVKVVTGEEITTVGFGHFNVYPMKPDPERLDGGAIDWGLAPGRDYMMTAEEIFQAVRALEKEEGTPKVIQVNHPWGKAGGLSQMGYFDAADITFLPDGTVTDGPNRTDPARLRLPPNSNIFSPGFDALEIYNSLWTWGREGRIDPELPLWAWFNLLNSGYRVTAMGNTDTHHKFVIAAGYPRNFIRVEHAAPAIVSIAEIVDGIKGGHCMLTNGPFVNVEVYSPSTEERGSMGDTVNTSDGIIQLTVSIMSPAWAPFSRLEIYSNPVLPGHQDEFIPGSLSTYALVLQDIDPSQIQRFYLDPENPESERLQFEKTFNLTGFKGERWIVVRVTGERPLFPVIPNRIKSGHALQELFNRDFAEDESVRVVAVTNPVYVNGP